MMDKVLQIRKCVRKFYQKYQTIIEIVLKFIISFLAYDRIVSLLNYKPILGNIGLKLVFGLVGAVCPGIITPLLCGVVAIYEVYCVSAVLALLVIVIFIVLFCFIARFSGKHAYAVVAIPLLFGLNLQYIVPLILGMTAGPMAMFPAACGVALYYVFKVVVSAASGSASLSFDDALALYIKVIDGILANKEMIFTIVIFAMVIIVMWLVRKIRFEFVFELNILLGAVLIIFGYIVSRLVFHMNVNIGLVVLGTFISVLIAETGQFLDLFLDYFSMEKVQFEDDEYYYYVTAIPKIDEKIPGNYEINIKDMFSSMFVKKENKVVKPVEEINKSEE